MHEVKGDSGNSQRRYETQDVTIRPMVWSAIGLAVGPPFSVLFEALCFFILASTARFCMQEEQ